MKRALNMSAFTAGDISIRLVISLMSHRTATQDKKAKSRHFIKKRNIKEYQVKRERHFLRY